jgi:hypothetical protein
MALFHVYRKKETEERTDGQTLQSEPATAVRTHIKNLLRMTLIKGCHKEGHMVKTFMVSGEYITGLQYFTALETKFLNQYKFAEN